MYAVAPLLDNYFRKLKYSGAVSLCAVLLLFFSGDQICSKEHPNTGKGITDYAGSSEYSESMEYETEINGE